MRTRLSLLLVILVVAACGSSEVAVIRELEPNPPDPYADPTIELFAPDHVVDIEIAIDPADWDVLRFQKRPLDDVFGANCLEAPPPQRFTYFRGDLVIEGDAVPDVGVSKKCFFGSCDASKPALKIKFNEYVSGQRYKTLRRLTLNNSKQDPSFVKQCLGYQLFADAGVPASRCNFAHVWVNGHDLGLYVHVESIKKEFLRRHFDDTKGNMYEAALSDFRVGWVNTWERKTNENPAGWEFDDHSDLDAMVAALQKPDSQVVAAVEPLIDMEEFFTFWAMESIIAHWDGYAGNTNNTYIYSDPTTGKWSFIPWGIDGILFDNGAAPKSVLAQGILSWRLYNLPEMRDRYVDRASELLLSVWDPDALLAEIDRMEALITPITDPDGTSELGPAIEHLRDFVRRRRVALLTELDAGGADWTEPLRDPPCLEEVGLIDATFDTTWGSVNAPDPWSQGSGTFAGDYLGTPWQVEQVHAVAGFDPSPDSNHEPILQILVWLADGTILVVHLVFFDPMEITTGNSVDLGIGESFGLLFWYDPATDTGEVLGLLLGGRVDFADADTTDGARVAGWVGSPVVQWGL